MRYVGVMGICTAALVVLPVGRTAAQTCQGTASFESGRLRAGGTASSTWTPGIARGQPMAYGLSVAYGAPRAWYATASATTPQWISPTDYQSLSGSIGYQLPLGTSGWEFCPALYFATGGYPLRYANPIQGGFRAALGYRFAASSTFELVPSFVLNVWPELFGATYVARFQPGLGVGMVVNRQWTILPFVGDFLSGRGMLGVSVTRNFGR